MTDFEWYLRYMEKNRRRSARVLRACVGCGAAVSRCRQHSCGLDGLVRVTVTSPVTWSQSSAGGQQVRPCDGTLSDWNPFTCTLTSRMTLTYRDCTADFAIVHRGLWPVDQYC